MQDLAPSIYRQRLVIEGYPKKAIAEDEIKTYLSQLSIATNMKLLNKPVTHRSDKFGWAGWVHWESSGAHFYAWDQPVLFYSVDIYTCKRFDPLAAVEFTKDFFDSEHIIHREF